MSNILLSHKITQEQKDAVKHDLHVANIIHLPENLQSLWGNIPPEPETIKDALSPLFLWLKENATHGDYALIQGDMGATYQMINYAFSLGIHPRYTTTKRVSIREENNDGTLQKLKKLYQIRIQN